MVFIVLLVAVVVVSIGGAIYNSIQRKKLVGNISNIHSLPGIDGLPTQASIDSGALGRAVAEGQYSAGQGSGS